jgi:hypothetical protein
MAIKIIPLKIGAITPNPSILSNVDKGLFFFICLGLAIFVLIVLEKHGVKINETVIRIVVYGAMGVCFLKTCLKVALLFG